MSDSLDDRILSFVSSDSYRPIRPRQLARELRLTEEDEYPRFRAALKDLVSSGRLLLGGSGNVTAPATPKTAPFKSAPVKTASAKTAPAAQAPVKPAAIPTATAPANPNEFTGIYRHNKRGFGFVVSTDPGEREDLFIPEGENGGALGGDVVHCRIINREQRNGKDFYRGRVTRIITRTNKKFVGTLVRQERQWVVLPDGNTFTYPILAPDAAGRHVAEGVKVVIELTTYPEPGKLAQGVITEVLGEAGEKDVDLRAVIVQFNLPGEFPEPALDQARAAIDRFNDYVQSHDRVDLSNEVICTIDPDDAKDYDDAISLTTTRSGDLELGVHIADVSFFVEEGSPLDEEARIRGNSCYFPGHVIPMLPEVLSNGVCSLQEGVPRLCKSAFITFDEEARPISTRFANTLIRSATRLRYREAQAIIDHAEQIPHPDGNRSRGSYDGRVIELLERMNELAKRIQQRRIAAGQINLELPEIELVLDENGKVVGTREEDTSFTHTLIEMFMVEANEAVARLLDGLKVPFLRRIHPEPDMETGEKLRHFAQISGYRLPKELDRKAIQQLLASVKGKPESFPINLSVLKSMTRAEYSPVVEGHYALASEHYGHFTSPIRRYADLTIHRLLDAYLAAGARGGRKGKVVLDDVPSHQELVELGKHLSFTERRGDEAERELRQVKLLELLQHHIGEDFAGVVTSVTNFGLFIQLSKYLIDGLIRYENLLDDWWDVDERGGVVRGQRSGQRIAVGDPVRARIVKVDPARRELDLAIMEVLARTGRMAGGATPHRDQPAKKKGKPGKMEPRGGGPRRNRNSKMQSRKPGHPTGRPENPTGKPGKRRGR